MIKGKYADRIVAGKLSKKSLNAVCSGNVKICSSHLMIHARRDVQIHYGIAAVMNHNAGKGSQHGCSAHLLLEFKKPQNKKAHLNLQGRSGNADDHAYDVQA